MDREKIVNIPNLLSSYRLLAFPLVFWLLLSEQEKLFSIFLCINLVTDILDGFIARTFKLQTRFGARLDSLADIGTYVLAVGGVLNFKWNEIGQSGILLWTFLGTYIFAHVVSFVRFGKFPSLHLYSCKVGGYLQGVFFFVLFFHGYISWMFHLAMIWGIASYIEEAVVLILLPEMRSNSKGLYWVLRG